MTKIALLETIRIGELSTICIMSCSKIFPSCACTVYAATFRVLERAYTIFRHSELDVTKVNRYALVFHWHGSDRTLKPILLAAHQGD